MRLYEDFTDFLLTMSSVFISYRQTNDSHRQGVRKFAERLRDCGIEVILDQFYLDANPGGPNDGWEKWSSDSALTSEYVLIIGSQEWFQCFEKTQRPGTGLGAACEADDLRHRIYEAGGVISNIRVVLFGDSDAAFIPGKLKPYHRFHGERDIANIARWLGGRVPVTIDSTPRTSIPNNLPSLQPFFGREEELKKIADALDPESRTWGALIDGPGGMGKTSLAVRAAYDVSAEAFERIAFVSLKSRELDDDGVRDLSGFLISGLAELLNELARELGRDDIAKAVESERPRMLLEALRGTKTLLILDNLESLLKRERDTVFTFVGKLPPGCKAILTARGRIGTGGKELILEKFSENAALATLASLAETNPPLAKTNEAERLTLYHETGGKPLLLRWTAGQIGRGSCVTFADAIAYLRSCPEGNDPLEFIFGDLVEDFSDPETSTLCALTYFTLPAKVDHIATLAGRDEAETELALKSLINRSLVVPSEELKTFNLVPLVGDFLRVKKPDVLQDTGDRLEKHAYALVMENGFQEYDRFPVLDAAWPTVAAALPGFLTGENDRLHEVCNALETFLDFSGRWDEKLALSRDAEHRALATHVFYNAGWRAYQAGWVHYLRGQASEMLACAERAEAHWYKARAGSRERAAAVLLRGHGQFREKNYLAAAASYRDAVALGACVAPETIDVAICLNWLANAEAASGDLNSAERDYREALRIARAVNYLEGVAYITGNLAGLALGRQDWPGAEALALEALTLAENVGKQESIAHNSRRIAVALSRQGKTDEAIRNARRAVKIFQKLASWELPYAQQILAACESSEGSD